MNVVLTAAERQIHRPTFHPYILILKSLPKLWNLNCYSSVICVCYSEIESCHYFSSMKISRWNLDQHSFPNSELAPFWYFIQVDRIYKWRELKCGWISSGVRFEMYFPHRRNEAVTHDLTSFPCWRRLVMEKTKRRNNLGVVNCKQMFMGWVRLLCRFLSFLCIL